MLKRLLLLAGIGLAISTTARAQPPEEVVAPAAEILQSAPASHFSILPRRQLVEPPSSAEEAEDLAALHAKHERFWLRSEFLVWWIKTASIPALVTTGPRTDPRPGSLDSANTRIRFGNTNADFQDRGGGRFTAGWWLDDQKALGVEVSYFFLSGRSLGQTFTSSGSPVIARPFFNTNTGLQDSMLIAFPGISSGNVEVYLPSFLQGAEANATLTTFTSESCRLEGLGGFRFLNLDESLHIANTSTVQLAPNFLGMGIPYNGNTIRVLDHFDTRNDFYGGQLGGRAQFRRKRFTLDLLAKAALGVSRESLSIRGSTTIDTNPAIARNGGLYALTSNSGEFTRNAFAVVPEAAINLKFQLTNHIQLFGGYTFLYWSSVAHPWDQLDQAVNVNQLPVSNTFGASGGPARPASSFNTTSFFAHGANFGVEFRW